MLPPTPHQADKPYTYSFILSELTIVGDGNAMQYLVIDE
jgi:hypothetical protein